MADAIKAGAFQRGAASGDGARIRLEFDSAVLVMTSVEGRKLLRSLQALATTLQRDTPPPTGTEKSFPVLRYEAGPGFPSGVGLLLETQVYGRLSFGMDPDTARKIAAALEESAARSRSDRPTPH